MASPPRTVRRTAAGLLIATALVCAAHGADPASASHEEAARKAAGESAESLFVVGGRTGSLRRVPGRPWRFELVLAHAGRVTSFTDRPARRAGSLSLAGFVRAWKRLGFDSDPPNAALTLAGAPAKRDVVILELRRPRLTAGGGIKFRARLVPRRHPRGLASFVRRADRRVSPRFGRASLFIDPGGAPTVEVVIRIANLARGIVSIGFTRDWSISFLDADLTGQIGEWAGSLRGVTISGTPPGATVNLTMQVTGTGAAVTGAAQVPTGVTVTALAPVSKAITGGPFSLPIGG
jgi:hypothetical protein